MKKNKLSKYIEPILWGLCILVIFNIIGNWFDSIHCNFDFEIFSSYITPSVTVITIYLGYKQYMDNKTSDITKELYKQDLEKMKVEEELFYEYFYAFTKFTNIFRDNSNAYIYYNEIDKLHKELYKKGDKLDILTSIVEFNNTEDCLSCPYHRKFYVDMIRIRKKLDDIRNKNLNKINEEVRKLLYATIEIINSYIDENEYKQVCNDFENEMNKIVYDSVKKEYFGTYKLYRSIEKQFIEEKRRNDYKVNSECNDCKYSVITYKHVEESNEEYELMIKKKELDNAIKKKGETNGKS